MKKQAQAHGRAREERDEHWTPDPEKEADEAAGDPGYRLRSWHSGLDPMDTLAEWGRVQGLFWRWLFNGWQRSRNRRLLTVMASVALLLWAPLIVAVAESARYGQLMPAVVCSAPLALIGAGMLASLALHRVR